MILSSKRRFLAFSFLMLLCLYHHLQAQRRHTISGFITDKSNGETLISASVLDSESGRGVVSNNYGHYSLTLPAGKVSLQYSYVGFAAETRTFTLSNDTVIHIKLDAATALKELTVVGQRNELGVHGTQMSAIEIPVEQIKHVPALFGENDLIKALQLLPGVQSGTEGSAGLYVRGGGPDQNLILLDGIPIYNVNHMFGFFSAFNTDAIKNVTLYKGSFPSRFGGRLSSVVDVRMKDGDDKTYHGSVSVGLISSKINFEGPIWKEKTTLNISGRRTYVDVLTQPLIRAAASMENEGDMSKVSAGYYFYDLNAKLTHKFSDKDKLFLSAYMGDDAVYAKHRIKYSDYSNSISSEWMDMGWDWGNAVAALRWNHLINQQLFMNITGSFTRYRSLMKIGYESETIDNNSNPPKKEATDMRMNYRSGIEDWALRADFDYAPHTAHDIKFGVGYTYHTFRPDVISLQMKISAEGTNHRVNETIGSGNIYAHETTSYVEDNITATDWLKVNGGLHFSTYHVQQKHYASFEPRLGLRLLATDKLSFKAGYARMSQYIHMLSNSSISMPTDLWVPATKRIEPMTSHQYAAGIFYNLNNILDLSLEGYYKTMDNLIEYKDGASFMGSATGWEEKVASGKGWSYGVEFLAQRSFGNTTGWIGYTWSKTERLFNRPGEELNFGKTFPAKYDRRHDISLTVTHRFSDKIDISGTWVFATGNTATLGLQEYRGASIPWHNEANSMSHTGELTHVHSRNNYRYNNYHRADIGINFHKKKKRGTRTWNVSIYNVYNQLNPFFVYPSHETVSNPHTGAKEDKKVLKQATLFPIMPSVSYSYKF